MTNTTHDWTSQINAASEIASRWIDDAALSLARNVLFSMLGEKRTKIMLYGAYSAGKSTIVNALLGEDVAPMADTPTTQAVTDYEWGDVILQDTPGVNAPIKHEMITAEALNRADLILFVLRAGEQDTQDVYDRLLSIIASGKPVMIVLNYETMDSSPGRFVAENHYAINEHLVALATQHGVTDEQLDQLQVMPLQARSALKAAKSGSQALLTRSGLQVLVTATKEWSTSAHAINGRAQAMAASVIQHLIDPALHQLEQRLPEGSMPDLDEASDNLLMLQSAHRRLRSRIGAEAARLVSQARPEFQAIQGVADNESDRQQRLETVFGSIQGKLFQFMMEEIPELKQSLVPASGCPQTEVSGSEPSLESRQEIDELLSKMKTLARSLPEDALANAVTMLMKSGSTWAAPLQKVLQKGAGDFLKANSKYLGPAVSISLDLVEIGRAAWAEEKYNQAMKAEEHRRQQQLSGWLQQITDSLSQQVNDILNALMEPELAEQKKYCEKLAEGAEQANTDRQALLSLRDQLLLCRR